MRLRIGVDLYTVGNGEIKGREGNVKNRDLGIEKTEKSHRRATRYQ